MRPSVAPARHVEVDVMWVNVPLVPANIATPANPTVRHYNQIDSLRSRHRSTPWGGGAGDGGGGGGGWELGVGVGGLLGGKPSLCSVRLHCLSRQPKRREKVLNLLFFFFLFFLFFLNRGRVGGMVAGSQLTV